jgi:PhnB protein
MAKKAAVKTSKTKDKPATKKKVAKVTTAKPKLKPKATTKATAVKAKKVSPIPKGYSTVTPYLIVANASKAIEFYKKAFAAKEVMRMDKPNGKIGHAELSIGGTKIMLADEFPEMGARGPQAFGGCAMSIHLYTKNVDATVKLAASLGAKVVRPAENMFYGDRIAMIIDPFGHSWSVATHVEDVSKATLKKRAAEIYSKKA